MAMPADDPRPAARDEPAQPGRARVHHPHPAQHSELHTTHQAAAPFSRTNPPQLLSYSSQPYISQQWSKQYTDCQQYKKLTEGRKMNFCIA